MKIVRGSETESANAIGEKLLKNASLKEAARLLDEVAIKRITEKDITSDERSVYHATAMEFLDKAKTEIRTGEHGMSMAIYGEQTWLTAAMGVLYGLAGNMEEAKRHLESIKKAAGRDKTGRFSSSPESSDVNTVSHLWTSILARLVGDTKTADEQSFSDNKHRRESTLGKLNGLYVSDSGGAPQTHMNAVIGIAAAQNNDMELAEKQLKLIEEYVPKVNRVHKALASKDSPSQTILGSAAASVAILKILVEGRHSSVDYCQDLLKLPKNTDALVVEGITFALLSGAKL